MEEKIKKVLEKIESLEESFVWKIAEGRDKLGNANKWRESHPRSVSKSIGRLLYFLVLSTNAKKILELGCSAGYSSLWMSLGVLRTGGHIYTTELIEEKANTAEVNFKESGVYNKITLIRGDIKEILKNWKISDLDLIFINANKEEYIS